jgi:hypothetical protein
MNDELERIITYIKRYPVPLLRFEPVLQIIYQKNTFNANPFADYGFVVVVSDDDYNYDSI